MEKLAALISDNEDRIIRILHGYTLGRGYAKYTSTLEEAWRLSVRTLSGNLVQACRDWGQPPELGPDDDFQNDPIAQFGIVEAQRHRERGISIELFLGLLKYYRQSYLDLVMEAGFGREQENLYRRFVDRFYDRLEIGLCQEWLGTDRENQLAGLQASNRQMTNEKNKYLTIFESQPHPVILLNSSLKVENLNQAAVSLLRGSGIPGSQYYCSQRDHLLEFDQGEAPPSWEVGRPLAELFPWLTEEVEAFARSGRERAFLEKAMPADAGPVHFEINLSSMLDISEKFSGMIVLLNNISARKQAEEKQAAVEAQLRQAQKMEAIGTLAGGVAHDFNNMLGAILGSVDLALMDVEASDPLHGYLMQIRQAARRSADLTRQILAFARKQIASPRNLDFNKEVVRILGMLKPLIGEDVSLIWKPGDSLWPVRMDPTQVDQVMTNLIVNARDAIAGVGTIVIETANQTLDEEYCLLNSGAVPGKYVRVSVNDTGAGMTPETLPHIFEPFFTTKEVGRGTGMGLSTVFGIIKQNDGYITVSSRPGDGTTFTIYLPWDQAKAAADSPTPEARPGRCGNETVLLVEDEEQILDTGKIILERHGYSVLAAGHPEDGLRLFDAHEPEVSLLITDVIMPGMNGRELWERLSARKPALKCLFISAYPAEVITARGLLEPGIHFIEKPFSLREFTEKVREVLDGETDTG